MAAEPMCNEITVAPAAEISAKRSKRSACLYGKNDWMPSSNAPSAVADSNANRAGRRLNEA